MPSSISNDEIGHLLTKAHPRLFWVDYKAGVSPDLWLALCKRYNWINRMATAVFFGGFIGGFLLPRWLGRERLVFWDVAVDFGIAVFLPCLWCFAITASQGRRTLDEFLIFYSWKNGIHWRGVFFFFYLPIMVFGALAAAIVY